MNITGIPEYLVVLERETPLPELIEYIRQCKRFGFNFEEKEDATTN